MAYTFDQIEARDPANPALVASNAFVTIFAPGDTSKTPLAITDNSGMPLTNPVKVNAMGYGDAFISDLDRVAWDGGGFSGFFTSYEGMKQVAVAAQEAAETAASSAGAEAAAVASEALAGAVADAGSAADAAAGAAASAAAAAGLVGAPADTAMAAVAANPASEFRGELSATILDAIEASGGGLDVAAIAYDRGRRALAEVNGLLAEVGEPLTVVTPVPATTATTIASGVEVNAWDVPNARVHSSIRTLRATPAQDAAGWPRENWVRSKSTLTNSLAPTYLPASAPVFELDYTGGKIDLLIRQGATSGVDAQADIYVDGKLAYAFTETIAAASGAGSGSLIRIPITFPSTRKRRIAVDFKATGTFAGWVRESTATSSYPDTGTKGPRVLLAGDSFGEGGSALPSGRPFIQWLAKMVGWADVHNVSAGSTGYYTAGTRVALKDRYQHDIIDQAPNIILYALGINDLDNYIANPNNVLNAATTAWDAAIAALPESEHVIIGPFFPRGGTGLPAAMVTMDAELKTRATTRGLRYISPIGEAWITGTGKVTAPAGDGNADIYISSDGTHPTPAGHKYLAWRIAGHLLTPAGVVA